MDENVSVKREVWDNVIAGIKAISAKYPAVHGYTCGVNDAKYTAAELVEAVVNANSTAPASPPSSVGEEAIGSERIKDALRKLIRNHHLARDVSEVYYKRINQNWRDASGLVRKPSVDPLIPALAFIEAAEDEAAR